MAGTVGMRFRACRDRPRWRPQSRGGARAGGIHGALLCGKGRTVDLWGDARQSDRRNRRNSLPVRPAGDCHRAAPGARAVARVDTAGDGTPRSADCGQSGRGDGDGEGRHSGRRYLHYGLSVPGGGGAGNAGVKVSETMSLVRSLLFSTPLIIVCTVVMGTLSLVDSFFDRTGNSLHQLARAWARMLLAVSFIRVRVEGLEKLDPRGAYVFVANHGSFMDIPALLASLPQQFRFFAKKSLFRIPFLGTHLDRPRHLPVHRPTPPPSLKSLSEPTPTT